MIVPQNRLLLWVALVTLSCAMLTLAEPSFLPACIAVVAAFGVVSILDAIAARRRLRGIGIALPPIVRMSKERESRMEVFIDNELQRSQPVRLALGMPPEVPPVSETVDVLLPASSRRSRMLWACMPGERGHYPVSAAYVECGSPAGFWSARKTVPVRAEIRVYPNLLTERRNLAGLFLHRGAFGLHAQRQLGKGREFEKLRDYSPGDSFEEIHWKATAKRGRPVTKVFQIERTQEVYVVIDASRLSARTVQNSKLKIQNSKLETGTEGSFDLQPSTSVLERFVTAALLLGLAAEQQGDLFGLMAFSDKVETFVRARNGRNHYHACRDALYALQPKTVTPDYDELCTFIRLRLRRRALLVVLTSLDDPVLAESFVRNAELIRRQHLVLVNMIQPAGAAPLFSDPSIAAVDDLYQHLGGHLLWHKLRELEKVLQRLGIRFSLLGNERLTAELVSQYLNVKQRQLL